MGPQIQRLLVLLQNIGLQLVLDRVNESIIVLAQFRAGKTDVVSARFSEDIVDFTCVVSDRSMAADVEDRLDTALLSAKTRLCHYSRNPQRHIVISACLPTTSLTEHVVVSLFDELKFQVQQFEATLTEIASPKRAVLLLPARLQPPHLRHFDGILRLLQGDESVLANPNSEEDVGLLASSSKLIISIYQRSREKGDPLSVGERRDLVLFEINNNPKFREYRHRIELFDHPEGEAITWLPKLLVKLHPTRPDAIVAANSATLLAARDLDKRHLAMHRKEGTLREGKRIRKLIVEGKLDEVKEQLSPFVFDRCLENGYFEQIKQTEGSF